LTYAAICDSVAKLKKSYEESDPFRLCQALGIHLIRQHLGKEPTAMKGFFLENKRIRTITVNDDLPLVIQRIIVAHEIGHAVLHRNRGVFAFHDITMYDSNTICEKEANLFAAELLLNDNTVLEALNRDSTFFSAAAELMVPAELLDFKFRLLKWKGYMMVETPFSVRSNFLKDLEVPENADYAQ